MAGVGLKSNPQGKGIVGQVDCFRIGKGGEPWAIMDIVRRNQDTFLEAWSEHIGG